MLARSGAGELGKIIMHHPKFRHRVLFISFFIPPESQRNFKSGPEGKKKTAFPSHYDKGWLFRVVLNWLELINMVMWMGRPFQSCPASKKKEILEMHGFVWDLRLFDHSGAMSDRPAEDIVSCEIIKWFVVKTQTWHFTANGKSRTTSGKGPLCSGTTGPYVCT